MLLHVFSAGQKILLAENICYAVLLLLLLMGGRIWLFYRYQRKAIGLLAVEIRKARCARLYGEREVQVIFPFGLLTDLRMMFDLTRWRFRDFYPHIGPQEL